MSFRRRLVARVLVVGVVATAGLGGCGGPGTAVDPEPRWVSPRLGIETVLVDAAEFVMGTPATEPMREAQETPHRVRITQPFYLGVTEVTQAQWHAVMGTAPSQFDDCGASCPVENVNAHQVAAFVARLSALEGEVWRRPTEAEWELACRAGATTPFNTGTQITAQDANFDGRYAYPGSSSSEFRAAPTPVGSFAPNAWGLFDMHGNVWEWTGDLHCPYAEGSEVDPTPTCDTELRVIRGGSWIFGADSMRCGLRYTHHPDDLGSSLGVRVLREVPS